MKNNNKISPKVNYGLLVYKTNVKLNINYSTFKLTDIKEVKEIILYGKKSKEKSLF